MHVGLTRVFDSVDNTCHCKLHDLVSTGPEFDMFFISYQFSQEEFRSFIVWLLLISKKAADIHACVQIKHKIDHSGNYVTTNTVFNF